MRILCLLLALPLLAAASAPIAAADEPIDVALDRARGEARAAEAEVERLERAAGKARGEAERLTRERLAAAAAIRAAEALISAADAEVRLSEALVASRAAALARRQAPVAALLAGIVTMGRRPPLLSIADADGLGEFIRVRALLDTTLPVIRARSAALTAELAESRRLERQAVAARGRLASARDALADRQATFAGLERKAIERAASLGAGAVGASDRLVVRSEGASSLASDWQRRQAERRMAGTLAAFDPAPPRPFAPDSRNEPAPIAYALPLDAPLVGGAGAVDDSGIRSRGITFDSRPGAPVQAPAAGTIAFAGPFRRHDGIVIIDHGKGWMSLITNVRTALPKGSRIAAGAPLGRALGPVTVELSTNGRPVSAALIARSSQLL